MLITGVSGYVASWIVKKLLESGIDVNGTVRDPTDIVKVAPLTELARTTAGRLRLFKADLLAPGSYDEPMRDCELVLHTASPFLITGITDPQQDLLRPAREGTRNVLGAAARNPTVKRVVLTSSVVAIYGDNADIALSRAGVFTEQDWNTTSNAAHQPYQYSKTIAEREAWAMAGEQEQWDLLTINPGWIFGPSLTPRRDSMSIDTMIKFGDGSYRIGVPEIWNGIADVRDVADAHIRAGYRPEASGRHIIVSGEATLLDFVQILRRHFGNGFQFPGRKIPKWLFWLIAPFYGYTREYVSKNTGIRIKFDNSYSKKDLGMSYIPIEQTILEHFQQLLDDGLLSSPARNV